MALPLDFILLASAARTATTSTPAQANTAGHKAIAVNINVTAVSGSPSLTPKIEGYDAASGTWYPILTGVAITGTGLTTLLVGPDFTAANNTVAKNAVPSQYRVTVTAGTTDSCTYSIGAAGLY